MVLSSKLGGEATGKTGRSGIIRIYGLELDFPIFPVGWCDTCALWHRLRMFTNITVPGGCALMVTSACCRDCDNMHFPWDRRNAPWLLPDDCSTMAGVILYSKGTVQFQKYLEGFDEQTLVGSSEG